MILLCNKSSLVFCLWAAPARNATMGLDDLVHCTVQVELFKSAYNHNKCKQILI